jgi:hypothetical protein
MFRDHASKRYSYLLLTDILKVDALRHGHEADKFPDYITLLDNLL